MFRFFSPRVRAVLYKLGTVALIIASIYAFFSIKAEIDTINTALTPPELPAAQTASKTTYLEQNWTSEQRDWYHHVSQGTATITVPYAWFAALEQPKSSPWLSFLGAAPLFVDNDYMTRFGFIAGKKSAHNPDGLPIGFAKTESIYFAGIDRKTTAVGFSCAACHTGQLIHNDTRYIIDGGPATTDLNQLTQAIGAALGQTALSSKMSILNGRYERFAKRVLKEQYNTITSKRLKDQLIKTLELLAQKTDSVEVVEGFGRLDALNRIGNQVFATDLNRNANYHAIDAPVNYPHIWTSSWFDWVQYDASIMQPLVRNAGEALGVKAYSNTTAPEHERFASSIPMRNLYELEQLLAGDNPWLNEQWSGLQAPSWPAEFGEIDQAKAQKGAKLYQQHCQGCHLPPLNSPDIWQAKYQSKIMFNADATAESFLHLNVIPLSKIGTDGQQAGVLANRTVDTTDTGLNTQLCTPAPQPLDSNSTTPLISVAFGDSATNNFGLALGAYVQHTIDQWMNQNLIPNDWLAQFSGNRPNCLQVGKGYKARPLNGIWATAPYLHNGAIANLYELLSPLAERATFVQLGSQQFDAQKVGVYQSTTLNPAHADNDYLGGLFILDTNTLGNSNAGHQFEQSSGVTTGIIGPEFTPAQRYELIEYLKTL